MNQLRLHKSSVSQLRDWRLACNRELAGASISGIQRLREVNSGRQVTMFMAKGRKLWQ